MFVYEYKIKMEDINAGNHVGNERALLFFQWAREKFFESLGLTELNIGDDIGVIQTEAKVQYKKQLFLDEIIDIVIENVRIDGLKMLYDFRIERKNEIAITGTTTLLAYDYQNQKVKKIPSSFIALLEKIKIDFNER